VPRLVLAFEGLLAGGAFALADLLACGLPLDSALPWWIAASGLLLGAAGALAGAASRRPGVATAAVVLLAHGLQWSAIASREWLETPLSPSAAGVLALVAASALAAALAAAALVRESLRLSAVLVAPGLVPAASFLATFLPESLAPRLAAAFAPSVLLGLLALVARRWRERRLFALPALVVALYAGTLHPAFTRPRSARREPPPPAAQRADPDAPDLLLVLVDSLRADHVRRGAMSPGTPALDRLAAEGIEFTQVVSSASWTLPSHASLFTGRAPADHGAVTAEARLRADLTTLAEALHGAGWATAAFTGGGFLVPVTGLDRGFDLFDARAELPEHAHARHTPLVLRVARNRFAPIWAVVNTVPVSGSLSRSIPRVEDWLSRRDRSRPFLLFVHTYQVHDYYLHQAACDAPDDSPAGARPLFAGRFAGRLWVQPKEIAAGVSGDEAEAFRRIYARRVTAVDAAIGELLDVVRAASTGRPLAVVVTSDHGEGFDAAAGRLMHGGRLHDDLLRVPLVLSAPGLLPAGRSLDVQVRLVDVMPTLLELAGVPPPEGLEGVSLRRLIPGQEEERFAWSEDGAGDSRRVSLRTPQWKLVRRGDALEAFDLVADPLERASRADAAPRALVERLERLASQRVSGPILGAAYDRAVREQLRQLGYGR
jgi:arylsulfatase A-like enzyme